MKPLKILNASTDTTNIIDDKFVTSLKGASLVLEIRSADGVTLFGTIDLNTTYTVQTPNVFTDGASVGSAVAMRITTGGGSITFVQGDYFILYYDDDEDTLQWIPLYPPPGAHASGTHFYIDEFGNFYKDAALTDIWEVTPQFNIRHTGAEYEKFYVQNYSADRQRNRFLVEKLGEMFSEGENRILSGGVVTDSTGGEVDVTAFEGVNKYGRIIIAPAITNYPSLAEGDNWMIARQKEDVGGAVLNYESGVSWNPKQFLKGEIVHVTTLPTDDEILLAKVESISDVLTITNVVPTDRAQTLSILNHTHDGTDSSFIATTEIHAKDVNGLRIEDDGGNLGIFIKDGGSIGVGISPTFAKLHVETSDQNLVGKFINTNATGGGLYVTPGNDGINYALNITDAAEIASRHTFYGNGNARLSVSAGSVSIGTANVPSGGGVPAVVLAQASGNPTGIPSNTAGLVAKDVSGTCELFAWDESGNVTQISAHNFDLFSPDPSYVYPMSFHSENPYLGKKIAIDLYCLAIEVEKLTGKKIIHIEDLPLEEIRNWDIDQEVLKIQREAEIVDWEAKKLESEENGENVLDLKPIPHAKKDMPLWLSERIL